MTTTSETFHRKIEVKFLRLIIAVIGLLLIQAFVDHLPMVENLHSTGQGTLPSVVSVIGAIIDTLIFVSIIACARDISVLAGSKVSQVRETDKIIMLTSWTIVIAMGYGAYQGIITPLLGRYAQLYDWFAFLLLLVPLAKLVFIIYHNLDPIVDMTVNYMERTPVIGKALITRNRSVATRAAGETELSKHQRDGSAERTLPPKDRPPPVKN
jgi:hypothetical protein